ncbi:unnamed protein product [Mytilus coruscus]|uniref:Uncharacterized protein n=1 Tax=Mytilus coruscus TaxID=42192 RepID=A0A6J8CYU5_MYTCO|nr:unnamed protein product [Mytilus coruscus]
MSVNKGFSFSNLEVLTNKEDISSQRHCILLNVSTLQNAPDVPEEPPPEEKYLHDLSPVNSPEPAESSLSNIQEPAPLDFTTSITNNQETAESSLNLNSTVSYIQEPAPLDVTTSITKKGEVPETVPVGVRSFMKEERYYLYDGTVLELKEVWTSDQPTPAPTEE